MKATVFIATSFDGFIARQNGDVDWLEGHAEGDWEDNGYGQFIDTVDAIVMGRKFYEMAVAALAEDWRSCDWLTEKERAMLEYSEKLTLTPYAMTKEDIDGLHDAGMDDEEILEAVIVCCTFNYVCRLVDALGTRPNERHRNSVLDRELKARGVVVDPKSKGL